MELSRRHVVGAAGALVVAAGAAACGGDPPPPTTTSVPGEWRAARDLQATRLLLDRTVRARVLGTHWDRPELVAALVVAGTVREGGRTPDARRRAEAALGLLGDAGGAAADVGGSADAEVLDAVAEVATAWFEVVDAPGARRGAVTLRDDRFVVALAADDLTGLCDLVTATGGSTALIWRATSTAWLDLAVRAAVRTRSAAGIRSGVGAARDLDATSDDDAVTAVTGAVALDRAPTSVRDFVDGTAAEDLGVELGARLPDGVPDEADLDLGDPLLLRRLRVAAWFAPVLAPLDRYTPLYRDGRLRPLATISGDRRAVAAAAGVVGDAERWFRSRFDGTLDLSA